MDRTISLPDLREFGRRQISARALSMSANGVFRQGFHACEGLSEKSKQFRMSTVKKSEIKQFTSWLGKRSYKARLERFGLERLQEIARENGKKGGRPVGSGKKQTKKGGA
jgi:hypothetical protein